VCAGVGVGEALGVGEGEGVGDGVRIGVGVGVGFGATTKFAVIVPGPLIVAVEEDEDAYPIVMLPESVDHEEKV
jgi:hypothetical protein